MTSNPALADNPANKPSDSAYDLSFHTLIGHNPLPLISFKGKVLLIVNTASKCGFTPQYESLEKLYETYKARGLEILGVPSNDFGSQEPGTDQDIAHFCNINYGVSFPMTAKEIVSGKKAHPSLGKTKTRFCYSPKMEFP
jgi:glutathione peroxidase